MISNLNPEHKRDSTLAQRLGSSLTQELKTLPLCPYVAQLDVLPAQEIGGDLFAWVFAKKVLEKKPILEVLEELTLCFDPLSAEFVAVQEVIQTCRQEGKLWSNANEEKMLWQKLPQFSELSDYLHVLENCDIAPLLTNMLLSYVSWAEEYASIHQQFKVEIADAAIHRKIGKDFGLNF